MVAEICTFTNKGIIRTEHVNLAFRVFHVGMDFEKEVSKAKELNSLRAKLHGQS